MKRTLLVVLAVIVVSGLLLSCAEKTPGTATTLGPTGTATTTHQTTTTTPTTAKTYNLKFAYHTTPTASMVGAYFIPWTNAIEAATNNQVKITHYGAESLVKAKDVYDAVVSGLCDIGLIDPSEHSGRFPRLEFDTLPLMFPDSATEAKVWWDICQKYSVNTELKEVQLLAVAVIAPSNYIGNKPAKDIADFKGLRIRTGGRTESWTIEALGGTPIEVDSSAIYSALNTGLIDSAFLSWSYILATGAKDVSKYSTECNLYQRAYFIVMNKKTWASLTPALQQIIMAQSGQENSAKYCAADAIVSAGKKGAVAGAFAGAKKDPIYTLTAEQSAAWKAAATTVWNRWASDLDARGLPGIAILTDLKALVTKYSAK